MGAEVIKFEHPDYADLSWLAPPFTKNFSNYYVQQNIGKKCIYLDLNKKEARKILKQLIIKVDILAENFRPETLASFNLDYENEKIMNKKLVFVSISGYGQNGLLRGKAAFAPTVHAECGTAFAKFKHENIKLNNFESMHSDFSHTDVYTSLEAAISCLAALNNAKKQSNWSTHRCQSSG